jgi:hypothetical protein
LEAVDHFASGGTFNNALKKKDDEKKITKPKNILIIYKRTQFPFFSISVT